jgi:hypothetical protein
MVRRIEIPERAAQLERLLELLCDLSVTLPEAAGLRARLFSLLQGAERGEATTEWGLEGAVASRTPGPDDEPAGPLPEPLRGRLGGRSRDVLVARRGCGVVLCGRCPTFHAKQVVQHEVAEFFGLPVLSNGIDVRGSS